jgi:hypothetical protein
VKTWTVWYRDPDGSSEVFSSDEWTYLAHWRRAEFTRKATRKRPFTSTEVVTIPWTAIRKLTETEEG